MLGKTMDNVSTKDHSAIMLYDRSTYSSAGPKTGGDGPILDILFPFRRSDFREGSAANTPNSDRVVNSLNSRASEVRTGR